jgi:hypothetical protein
MLDTAYDSNERPELRDASRWAGTQMLYSTSTVRGLSAATPRVTPWGTKSFQTIDPDNYRLTFSSLLTERAPSDSMPE